MSKDNRQTMRRIPQFIMRPDIWVWLVLLAVIGLLVWDLVSDVPPPMSQPAFSTLLVNAAMLLMIFVAVEQLKEMREQTNLAYRQADATEAQQRTLRDVAEILGEVKDVLDGFDNSGVVSLTNGVGLLQKRLRELYWVALAFVLVAVIALVVWLDVSGHLPWTGSSGQEVMSASVVSLKRN